MISESCSHSQMLTVHNVQDHQKEHGKVFFVYDEIIFNHFDAGKKSDAHGFPAAIICLLLVFLSFGEVHIMIYLE